MSSGQGGAGRGKAWPGKAWSCIAKTREREEPMKMTRRWLLRFFGLGSVAALSGATAIAVRSEDDYLYMRACSSEDDYQTYMRACRQAYTDSRGYWATDGTHQQDRRPPAAKSAYTTALAQQQARAKSLSRSRQCPHCAAPIARLDAISLMHGNSVAYKVRVRLADGSIVLVDSRQFSPQTMLWADGD